MNPFFGDTYSYPWKRGPHDNLPEYYEALPTFDNVLRQSIYSALAEFDYLGKLNIIYSAEDENHQVVTKVCILRILVQLLRMKEEVAKIVGDQIIAHNQTMTLLNNSSLTSKDGIVSSCCLQILSLLQRHLITFKKDVQNPVQNLKVDITKLIDFFEKTVQNSGEPLIANMICGILSDCLQFENQTSTVIYGRFANQPTFTML